MAEALSKHEWILMEALWNNGPAFLSEIMERLSALLEWKRGTYLTYLKRLGEKGCVGFNEIRGSRSYYPLVTREDCVRQESRSMVSKMTHDSARLFLACMIKDSGLSEESANELRTLIDELAASKAEV